MNKDEVANLLQASAHLLAAGAHLVHTGAKAKVASMIESARELAAMAHDLAGPGVIK